MPGIFLSNTNTDMTDALALQKQEKIRGVKHKLYVLSLLVLLFIFYPIFSNTLSSVRGEDVLGSILQYNGNFVEGIINAQNGGLLGQIQTIQEQIKSQDLILQGIKKDQQIISFLGSKENIIPVKKCIENESCQGFSDSLKKSVESLRNFLVLSAYSGNKMNYDQKTLLENIDRYILKDDDGNILASLEAISFSQPLVAIEKEKIYKVPFVMTLQFENEKQFLSCIQRIEKSIYNSAGVVYKIGAMNYDIAKFSQNQKVDMTMYAYFYKE